HRKPRRPCARGFPGARRQELDEAHPHLARPNREDRDRLPAGARLHAHQPGGLYRAEGEGLLEMVQFNLPKNSKITEGKAWPTPAAAQSLREYRIYRWEPEDGRNPRIDTYQVDTADCGPMVLD